MEIDFLNKRASLSGTCHRLGAGTHQQPHGAGFIGGSALHPINRMPIFLADTNDLQPKSFLGISQLSVIFYEGCKTDLCVLFLRHNDF